jgi:hypothetical protein
MFSIRKPIIALLAVAVLSFGTLWATSGCGEKKDNKSTTEQQAIPEIVYGKKFLSVGEHGQAYLNFDKVLQQYPENCDALWGILLADTLELLYNVNTLLNMVIDVANSGVIPKAQMKAMAEQPGLYFDLYPFINLTVGNIDTLVQEMNGFLVRLEKKGDSCTFTLDAFPIKLLRAGEKTGVSFLDNLWMDVKVYKKWTTVERTLIAVVVDLVQSTFNLLFSHDISVNLSGILDNLKTGDGYKKMSIVEIIRYAGFIFDTTPPLLGWSNERKNRFNDLPKNLASLCARAQDVFKLFTAKDQQDNVISFLDKDRNETISNGDIFTIHAKGKLGLLVSDTNLDGTVKDDVISYTWPLITVPKDVIDNAKAFLEKLRKAFADELPPGTRIGVQDINKILQPIGLSEVLQNVIELDLKALLQGPGPEYKSGPQPIKWFLPALYDDDVNMQTARVFMVEGEAPKDLAPTTPMGFTKIGDAAHFDDKNSSMVPGICAAVGLGKDGLTYAAEKGIIGDPMTFIIAFNDPTMNGALYLDLGPIETTEITACKGSSNGFQLADNYSLNAVIAYFLDFASQISSLLPK